MKRYIVCPTCDGRCGEYVPGILTFMKCKRCGGRGEIVTDGDERKNEVTPTQGDEA